jgi:hypothetical protein
MPEIVEMENVDESLVDDHFLVDVDKAFETIQLDPIQKTPSKKRKRESEFIQMQATFLAVAQVHLGPVLRYLKAIKLGISSKDLCEMIGLVIDPLIPNTREVGLLEQADALKGFKKGLKKYHERDPAALAQSFLPVEKSFLLNFRGHSPAVVNLLGYYKRLKRNRSLRPSYIQKLFAIGIPSLTMIRKSSFNELQSLSGIPIDQISILRSLTY